MRFPDATVGGEDGHLLGSFGRDIRVAIIGASGGIGGALVSALARDPSVRQVFAFSRSGLHVGHATVLHGQMDIESEDSIREAAQSLRDYASELHLVIVASGILHDGADFQPEKTWRALDGASLERAFRINAIGPALVAKHFLPLLARQPKSAFAALSARVGSISDNRLGGWHAYRSSKAALNMLLRTLSIELARTNPNALCVGLHPGTVDSRLSNPFQTSVPAGKLFSPEFAADRLLKVLDGLSPPQSGGVFAWDGKAVPF